MDGVTYEGREDKRCTDPRGGYLPVHGFGRQRGDRSLHRNQENHLACCIAEQACRMRRSVRYIRLPDLLMGRDEQAATERSNVKILRKYARCKLLRTTHRGRR